MRSQALLLVLSAYCASACALEPIGQWGQCGGQSWDQSTECVSGFECVNKGADYSQCMPSGSQGGGSPQPATSAAPPASKPSPVSVAGSKPSPSSSSGGGSTSGVNTSGSCGPYSGDKTGLASTTNYYDGQVGACGCGSNGAMDSWQSNPGDKLYTAAGSQNLFGGSGSWCGSGCGTCYELTNMGSIAATGQGKCTGAGQTITVMITNLCPADGNAQWCSVPDSYGFPAHFDIMSQGGGPSGWNNPTVSYKSVACPGSLTSDYGSCQCATGKMSRVRRGLLSN